jgi:hypothetical protein
MHYNICIIQPNDYAHSMAFWELGEALSCSFQELGHTSSVGINNIIHDRTNIIVGCHLLDVGYISTLPASTIILNVEQVYADDTAWNAKIFEWIKHFETWDYSERNIVRLREMGAKNVKHLRLGFQKELSRFKPAQVQDIDVLFYGSMNPRRGRVLEAIEAHGLVVKHLFGVYGQARDSFISRSKLVLNMHFARYPDIRRRFSRASSSNLCKVAPASSLNTRPDCDRDCRIEGRRCRLG